MGLIYLLLPPSHLALGTLGVMFYGGVYVIHTQSLNYPLGWDTLYIA
jgi:hypothetical protein